MDYKDIFALWQVDSEIDPTELGQSALDIAKLHHKYYQIYIGEKRIYLEMKKAHDKLKFEKREFYIDGPNEDTRAKGWVPPPKGRIAKMDVQYYLDADTDLADSSINLAMQETKMDFLYQIITKILTYQSQRISLALEDMKFKNGA